MNTETQTEQPDPIAELIRIGKELQALCPKCDETENGKYINLNVSGFSELSARVYYGMANFDVESIDDLKGKLAAFDPEEQKRRRIESLKNELAALEAK